MIIFNIKLLLSITLLNFKDKKNILFGALLLYVIFEVKSV